MSGTVGKVDGEAALVAEANPALDLVGSDPRRALAAADAVLPEASRGRSPEAVATAQRAAGLALRNMCELTAAETRLRAGVRSAANRAPRAAAEARMSLAFVLLERGRVRAALNQADRAASSLKGVAAARLRGQRALVLQRSGRTNDALSAYADAIPVLQKSGDKLWEAGLRNNRALLNAYGGSFAAAERDLHRARHLWNDLGQELPAADVECNLGFLAALKGDVPEALARYDEAEGLYKAQGRPTSRLLLDRCAVLLSVGLYTETAEVAARAIEDLEAKGAETDLGEGLLVLAQALLGCGDANGAAAQAKRARQLFERQARPGWALLARYVALRAQA